MKLDLYIYYKKYYQRWYKNPQDDNLFEMKEISHRIALLIHKNIRNVDDRHITQALELAEELFKIEKIYSNFTNFSVDIINALNKKDFEVNVPHQVAHRWNFNPEFSAFIYVAISDFRPHECKLGVTTLSPEIRANKYTTKYGYRITIYNYVDAINPYEIEAKIANDLSNLRVSKNTEGDSIEWYRIKPSEMFAIVQNEINK
jgi:hypothetical protein